MKKLAIVLALLGVTAAASAQTSTTVYGIVDMGFERDFGNARSGLDSGLQSGSRIGFRGTEDIGGGTSVIFGLEAGFNADDGSFRENGLFDRQSYVGLTGPMGTVKLGKLITPIYSTLYDLDPFNNGLAGNARNAFNAPLNMSNAGSYSHSLGPVTGTIAYGLSEKAGDYKDGRVIGASANASLGPVNAAVAYHGVDVAGDKAATWLVGATGQLTKGVKLHGAFADNRGLLNHDTRNYMVGTSLKATGVDTMLASVVHTKDRTFDDANSTQYAIGWQHDLSKRTNLYTSYGHTKHDAKETDKVVNVGIRHKF